MPSTILGLDIGGANLKAAIPGGPAVTVPFALWKESDRLPQILAEVCRRFPAFEQLAVTMTGELCDCFPSKRDGVEQILAAVEAIADARPIRVWSTAGKFLTLQAAKTDWRKVAAANWHALATWVGATLAPQGPALLLDLGSTTMDLIPLKDGRPASRGLTDPERLRLGELLYTGVRRTPVCSFWNACPGLAAEFFATTLDVYLILGAIPEDETDTATADGRPATRTHAHARMSRMLGGDGSEIPERETLRLAEQVRDLQWQAIVTAVRTVYEAMNRTVATLITAGSGDWLLHPLREFPEFAAARYCCLSEHLGSAGSSAAPAVAVAHLAQESSL